MTAIDALSADIRYDGGAAAVLIADLGGAGAGDRLATALGALGGRLMARIDWHVPLDRSATPRIILVDTVGINGPLLAERMAQIVAWAADTDAALVVALRPDQIDAITALTLGGATSLLVDPGIGECVAAVAIAIERSRQPAGVFDVTRESDGARLERLSAEVGRIAEALARLTQADHDRPSDPPRSSAIDRSPIRRRPGRRNTTRPTFDARSARGGFATSFWRHAVRGSGLGHAARSLRRRSRAAPCVGIEPVHRRSRRADDGVALDRAHDR
ncbi:hypothetical protein QP185_09720 [Sphingomonas aerolata]|uniref:hypothetical protein n=1 Tax=Sphingomonas aerolata TaxID=185951 RepID=UPI002FE26EF0